MVSDMAVTMGDRGPDKVPAKLCCKCGEVKSLESFHRHPTHSTGRTPYCKVCTSAYSRKRYREKREEIRKRQAEYNSTHSAENVDRVARWRVENPEKYRAQQARQRATDGYRERQARYREANRETSRAYSRAHYARNAELYLAYSARRRALKRGSAIGAVTPDGIASRWSMWGGKCYLCGATATATDHVKPLHAGGAHMLANLRPICTPCNGAKSALWPLTEVFKLPRFGAIQAARDSKDD